MKNNFTLLFYIIKLSLLFAIIILIIPTGVFAVDAASSASSTKINAKILPTIWYSTLSINDGESIQIFSGIQNNSGISFDGTATFLVDDKEIVSKNFSSYDGALKELSADWVAIPGDHDVQIKISASSLPADKVLVSYNTDKFKISITRKITAEVIQKAVLVTASSVTSGINSFASGLAKTVEGLKTGGSQKISSSLSASTSEAVSLQKGSVLGTSTKDFYSKSKGETDVNSASDAASGDAGGIGGPLKYAYNLFLDLLAFLIKNWKWSLGAIIILFLFLKFIGRR